MCDTCLAAEKHTIQIELISCYKSLPSYLSGKLLNWHFVLHLISIWLRNSLKMMQLSGENLNLIGKAPAVQDPSDASAAECFFCVFVWVHVRVRRGPHCVTELSFLTLACLMIMRMIISLWRGTVMMKQMIMFHTTEHTRPSNLHKKHVHNLWWMYNRAVSHKKGYKKMPLRVE